MLIHESERYVTLPNEQRPTKNPSRAQWDIELLYCSGARQDRPSYVADCPSLFIRVLDACIFDYMSMFHAASD